MMIACMSNLRIINLTVRNKRDVNYYYVVCEPLS